MQIYLDNITTQIQMFLSRYGITEHCTIELTVGEWKRYVIENTHIFADVSYSTLSRYTAGRYCAGRYTVVCFGEE